MPNTSLQRILYVEDDEALARLLQKRMERKGFRVYIAASAEEGLKSLAETTYDLVLIDYNLPGMSGVEMLETVTSMEKAPPAIILTASGDEAVALAAMEKGAADYAVKDAGQTYLDLLPAVMQAAYTRERLMRENERQRSELEAAVEKAEAANSAKSNFLATMSHEIRTPMNVVTGLAHILGRTPLNEDQKKIVQTLQNNADLLLKLINDLLDISRIESGQVELESIPFTMGEILEDVRLMFASQASDKHLLLEIEDATGNAVFDGDRTRIQQIIMNLVSNAIKFTEQGKVFVTAKAVLRSKDNASMIVEVRDSGIGICADKLPFIFEKFTQADETITRRFGGSGLGLSIARSLAGLMGGDITVSTQEGKGSVFTFTLMLKQSTARGMPVKTDVSQEPHPAMGKVLIVEDYAPNIMVASMMVENLGFAVETAESGEQAIHIISAITHPFLAILMDVQMHGMDGMEATRHIRRLESERGFRHTIIGVTAHALAGDRERCISAGMDDYISKPIHPDILAAKLSQLAAA